MCALYSPEISQAGAVKGLMFVLFVLQGMPSLALSSENVASYWIREGATGTIWKV